MHIITEKYYSRNVSSFILLFSTFLIDKATLISIQMLTLFVMASFTLCLHDHIKYDGEKDSSGHPISLKIV